MSGAPPEFRVVRGRPDAEELAALTVVLLAVAEAARHRGAPPRECRAWAAHEAPRGPGAWRRATRWAA